MAGLDITTVAALYEADSDGTTFPVLDEQGNPYGTDDAPVTITVLGKRSRAVRKAQMKNALAYSERKTDAEPTLDETLDAVESGNIEVAIAATSGWVGIVADGESVPCTPDNARRLYAVAPHIVTQVVRAMSSRDADFRTSSASGSGSRRASGDALAGAVGRQATEGSPRNAATRSRRPRRA